MYLDKLALGRATKSARCDVCRKRSWSHGRTVAVRLVARIMPGPEWIGLAICKKCLAGWLEKLTQ